MNKRLAQYPLDDGSRKFIQDHVDAFMAAAKAELAKG
jgi:hypothetical protein